MFQFFRARLSRVIFMWFAFTIVAAVVLFWVVGGLYLYLGEGTTKWDAEMQRIARYVSLDLGPAWNDPDARRAWLERTTDALEVEARIVALDGTVLEQTSEFEDCRGMQQTLVITHDGEQLGTLQLRNPRSSPLGRPLFVLIFISLILMVASGIVARRLGRPLRRLSAAAQDFGEGQLARRVAIAGTGELQEVSIAFNEMADRITDQLEGQRRLLAEVSHELRTPLGHLRLLVEIIRDAGPSAKRLDKLEREIEAMDELVDQLLAGARLDFDLERADPVDLVDIAVMAAERVGKPELLDVGPGVSDALVRGDSALLVRAISNLVQNAEDHGGGLTRLAVERIDDGVIFRVQDEGPGIENPAAALDEFRQGDSVGESGLGLGLALVDRIATAHGARLSLKSSDEGTSATVWLPTIRG